MDLWPKSGGDVVIVCVVILAGVAGLGVAIGAWVF